MDEFRSECQQTHGFNHGYHFAPIRSYELSGCQLSPRTLPRSGSPDGGSAAGPAPGRSADRGGPAHTAPMRRCNANYVPKRLPNIRRILQDGIIDSELT